MSLIRKLAWFFRAHWQRYLLTVSVLCLIAVIQTRVPAIIGNMIDIVINTNEYSVIWPRFQPYLITLLAICVYRTMTVAIVADITPRPLRTKADSVQKIVGYADTGVMLVAISVMVPNVERPDYLPLFLLQAAFVLVSAVVYDLLVKEPALVQKMRQKSLEMGIREDEVEKFREFLDQISPEDFEGEEGPDRPASS